MIRAPLAVRIAEVADGLKARTSFSSTSAMPSGMPTGSSSRPATRPPDQGHHDAVLKEVKDDLRIIPKRVEGVTEATWILMDYLDVVLHVFTPDARDFYRLERLYGDVPREDFGTPTDRAPFVR